VSAIVELLILKSKKLALAYVLIAIGGPFVEVMAVYFGAWQYTLPTFIGIPVWLIPAWGNAGIIAISVYKSITKFFKK